MNTVANKTWSMAAKKRLSSSHNLSVELLYGKGSVESDKGYEDFKKGENVLIRDGKKY